jgi:hypothetical protein
VCGGGVHCPKAELDAHRDAGAVPFQLTVKAIIAT